MQLIQPHSAVPSLHPIFRVVVSSVLLAGFCHAAGAAEHRVALQTAKFDCSSAKPGDTVTLAAGTRGQLNITNCNGTSSNPITIRNDPAGNGPTVIQQSSGGSGGFVFTCSSCVGVVIDGTTKWAGAPSHPTYGIKVAMAGGGSPSAFLRLTGLSRFVVVRGVEVDGGWPALATNGIGISVNDHDMKAINYPGVWTEGVTIENNYVHDVEGEGLYVGPNWYKGNLPLRDIVIRNNLIEDTGWDGIQLKSAIGGTNLIHHNVLRRVGQQQDHGQLTGISLLDGTGRIYNNWIEKSGDAGIRHFLGDLPRSYGDQVSEIYNNVIVDSGQVRSTPGHGIASNSKDGFARPIARIYNNTVVGAMDSGILVGGQAAGGFVRDNVVANSADKPIVAPTVVSQSNNRVGSVSEMAFVDAPSLDFRLRASSPARNAGSSSFPLTDFNDVPRPQDGRPAQGAFEYVDAAAAPRPQAPQSVAVE